MENCPLTGSPCSNSKTYQIILDDGKEYDQKMVCEKCAYQQYKKNSEKALLELLGMIENISDKYYENIKKCSECKSSFEDLMIKSRLGCPMCYESFRDKALAMFTRCQVGYMHIGKRPKRHEEKVREIKIDSEIENLRSKIQLAVKEENYELANELKKEIDKLKNKKAQHEI